MYIYIYIYIHTYIHTYVYTYTCTYTHLGSGIRERRTKEDLALPALEIDAGGSRFETQTGRVRCESTPSLWRDKHPLDYN